MRIGWVELTFTFQHFTGVFLICTSSAPLFFLPSHPSFPSLMFISAKRSAIFLRRSGNKALSSELDRSEVGQSMQGRGERALCPPQPPQPILYMQWPLPNDNTPALTLKGGGGWLLHSASVKRFQSSTMLGRSRQVQARPGRNGGKTEGEQDRGGQRTTG